MSDEKKRQNTNHSISPNENPNIQKKELLYSLQVDNTGYAPPPITNLSGNINNSNPDNSNNSDDEK